MGSQIGQGYLSEDSVQCYFVNVKVQVHQSIMKAGILEVKNKFTS